jgi:hypothetical protein
MPHAVGFYVTAHQDDWQLFRGEQAWADLNTAGVRIVFVYTTAGDAGATNGWWEARERGAIDSIRAAIPAAPLRYDVRTINGHPISCWECGNSASYCLRLPDGVGTQSLSNLRDGVISSLTAIDHSTTYTGWTDFRQTLQAILQTETAASTSVNPWLNAPDYNTARNPNDHSDHRATADALRHFVSSGYGRAWWVSYDAQNRPVNLSGTPYNQKKAVFDAYGNSVLQSTTKNGSPVQPNATEWALWGARSYVTIRPFGSVDD